MKTDFNKQGEADAHEEKTPISEIKTSSDIKEMTPLEISALCTNLARGCEKQYKVEEANSFNDLAEYFKKASVPAKDPDYYQVN